MLFVDFSRQKHLICCPPMAHYILDYSTRHVNGMWSTCFEWVRTLCMGKDTCFLLCAMPR